ncbi:DUF2085 domain-containing protein [Neobacillus sp. YX16]|uniref:DUF2085 domain-containing protein n=1 Tax=Neobacillus sp. YX16 TaxID=3047874 RepID=UPI0024C274B8|nr:DUF2085 domain-containing protein [Neobacillus sp. YX16]WHZ02272.1 DUF2085 domain-containing protein [Neobacillus sp. YX16]
MLLHEILHFFGRAICHQLEDRSLQVSGNALTVCARDTGIYIGVFSTLIYLQFTKRKQSITIPSIKVSFVLLMFLFPLMIDGLGSYTHLFDSNNPRRLVTGIAFGFILPYFIYPLLSKKNFNHESVAVLSKSKDLFIPLMISAFLGGLFYLGQPSHIVLDSFIIFSVIGWFSLLSSFLFPFIRKAGLKCALSIMVSLTFLSLLSMAHAWVLSLPI